MRVIITGGTGLIGRELVRNLQSHGHGAVVLSRHPEGREVPGNVDMVKWDAESPEGWVDEVEKSDAIVNLAGENIAGSGLLPDRWTERKKRRILNSRLKAGKAVTEAVKAADNRPEVVVQASAVGYYGTSEDKVFTEDSPPGEDFLADVAVEWEGVTAPVEELGIRRLVIRTGIVLSSKGGVLPRLTLPHRFFLGGPLGSGRQWYSWIHIEDEVRAIRFLLESEEVSGAVNLTAPNPRRNAEFAEELGSLLDRPSSFRVPTFLIRAIFGEASTLVVDGQRVRPARLEELGFEFNFAELDRALSDLTS